MIARQASGDHSRPWHRPEMTSIDYWTLGYAVVAAAAIVWRMPLERIPALLAIHALLAALVLMMPRARRVGPLGRFLGDWYPLLIVTALYTEVGVVNLADGRAYDRIVLGWEQALFGFQPARDWIRSNPSAWLSWALYVGYLAYYPIIAAGPLALWATDQREAMRRAMTTIMATFYVCYTIFLLFPVVGPRHIFPAADNVATRTMIAQLTAQFIEHVAAWGAAFPSSHVAVSVAATVAALLEWRVLGASLVVPTTLLALGSVYGQFHYAVDVLAGLGVGLAVAAAVWLTARQPSDAQRRVPNARSQRGLDTPKRVSGRR